MLFVSNTGICIIFVLETVVNVAPVAHVAVCGLTTGYAWRTRHWAVHHRRTYTIDSSVDFRRKWVN